MPPCFFNKLAGKTKRRNACAARPAFGSQKELTSIFSKPTRTRSSRASDVRPNAGCSSHCYSRDHIAGPDPHISGRRGLRRDRDRLDSCCNRDLDLDRGPGPYLDPGRDLCLCRGRGMLRSVEPSGPMPKPNRR
jgi:hypothetical protein